MNYLFWLLGFSAIVAGFEALWPARQQKQLRTWLWSDVLHVLFNGHLLGLMLYGVAFYHVLPVFDGFLAEHGWTGAVYRNMVGSWGLVTQSLVALVVLDLVQWLVHNTLHRSSFLWNIHQVHHSVEDGEMDWIVSFRFSWLEPVYYKAVMYLPAIWFGFAPEALFFHAVFGTLIGHLNHANLTWDYGPLRYVLNSPRMHLYHHDFEAPRQGQNFGIILSCWDWMFGTAHLPAVPPKKIGFPGVEKLPNDFFGHLVWPLSLWVPTFRLRTGRATSLVASVAGLGVLGMLSAASAPPTVDTPMFGEQVASSQPVAAAGNAPVQHATTSAQAQAAIARFGNTARAEGWAQPESAVDARELAEALGDPRLVILDVRTPDRFAQGHIPSAQLITRGDYSGGPIPGVSLDRAVLQEVLRTRGVSQDSEIVIMGDGGPEPYRLWWTLEQVAGVKARVLNGGLAAWKNLGERLAEGEGLAVDAGDVIAPGGPGRNLMWADLEPMMKDSPQLLDTRKKSEFDGQETHHKAARAGHISSARHLVWTEVLELVDEVPFLKSPAAIQATVAGAGIDLSQPIVTYCQSGTRSSATYYALLQAGIDESLLWNYDGSWAEYSRLDSGSGS